MIIQILGIEYSIFGYGNDAYLRITLGFLGMEENDDLGRYIQARLRAKNIEDKDVAAILNISVKTVHKIYPNKDLYSERVAKFCLILNENIFLDFYGKKEPLKTLLNKDKNDLINELAKSKTEAEEYKKIVGILNTQLLVGIPRNVHQHSATYYTSIYRYNCTVNALSSLSSMMCSKLSDFSWSA